MSGTPKYILTERIAQGGMAEIHLGKIVGSDGFSRVCAFKRILPHFAQDKEFVQMFRQEAMVAKQLQNKNIVQVYDFVSDGQSFMLVMEFVDGQDLRSVLAAAEEAKRKISIEISCYILIEMLSGLSFAHSALDVTGKSMNIIHRDVSPQNVLLSYEGDVKITDFGIAKVQNSSSTTQAGVLKGKFRYMSPEQASGKEMDARSDLFAAGVILYEMITMTRLFKGEDMAVLEQVRRCNITPPTGVRNTRIPAELEAIIMRLLAKDPSHRYQTAKAAVKDLSRFLYSYRPDFFAGEVAEFMQIIFRDKLSTSRERLRSTLALPVDAIGRSTRGMDVVAPESFMNAVVDVSQSGSMRNAARLGAGSVSDSRSRQAMRQSDSQEYARANSQSKALGQQGQIRGGRLGARRIRSNDRVVGGRDQPNSSQTKTDAAISRFDENLAAPVQLSENSLAVEGFSRDNRALNQTLTNIQLRNLQMGSQASMGQHRLESSRIVMRRKKSSHALLYVGLLFVLAMVAVFTFALRKNEIPYTVVLELNLLPKVPFRVEVQGKNVNESRIVESPFKMNLRAGEYDFRIFRPGFEKSSFKIKTSILERSIKKSIVLEKDAPLGQLRLITSPPGAEITSSDGFFKETSPALLSFLPLGRAINLTLRHPRCAPTNYREVLPRGSEQTVLTRSVVLKDCK